MLQRTMTELFAVVKGIGWSSPHKPVKPSSGQVDTQGRAS